MCKTVDENKTVWQIIVGREPKALTIKDLKNKAKIPPQDIEVRKSQSYSLNASENDLDGEFWKEHPDYPKYKISNLGRVKYNENLVPQKNSHEKDEIAYGLSTPFRTNF